MALAAGFSTNDSRPWYNADESGRCADSASLPGEDPARTSEADRRTLIRRATFDLHGLPPTPQEVADFLADQSPQAFERVIDRLLASPRYGEHWARYWLDLVRYAESDGFKSDDVRPNAWRYRDYVIRSFNDDKPYDRFVSEQLAGDELAPDDLDARVATGFLRLGPYEENARDVLDQRSNLLNDMTDVTGQVFLGLTFACARCHDHKYDPDPAGRLLSLAGLLRGTVARRRAATATAEALADYDTQLRSWEEATAAIARQSSTSWKRPIGLGCGPRSARCFPTTCKSCSTCPRRAALPWNAKWSNWPSGNWCLDPEEVIKKMNQGRSRAQHEELSRASDALCGSARPAAAADSALTARDIGPTAPETRIPNESAVDRARLFEHSRSRAGGRGSTQREHQRAAAGARPLDHQSREPADGARAWSIASFSSILVAGSWPQSKILAVRGTPQQRCGCWIIWRRSSSPGVFD